MRFKAFISYSHSDTRVATWLHRRLEGYRLPRGLRDGAGRPLTPIFRDRDELASSSALTDSIQAALDASEALVVVCSPAAVRSRWVGEEIEYFRRTHPQRKVLAFVAGGDPDADPLADPASACFPHQLLLKDPADPSAGLIAPAAPDARKHADGREAAFLKLVAGLLELPYDQLRQRELRRQQRRWTVVGASSLALTCLFALLAWQALVARDAAQVAQARAEVEAATARQTAEFMVSLFEVSEPGEARGNTITAREVLDAGVERIERAPLDNPLVKSRLLGTMGRVYAGLGMYPLAGDLLRKAEVLVESGIADEESAAQRFDVQWELASLLYAAGEYEQADDVLARIEPPSGQPGDAGRRRAKLANLAGDLAWQAGEDDLALGHYRQALEELAPFGDTEPVQLARALGGIGRVELLGDTPQRAMPHLDRAFAVLAQHFGPDHPETLMVLNLRASAAYQAGDTETARVLWTEALASGRKIYGDRHPEVATYLSNLGLLELEASRFDEAERMFRETLAIDREARAEQLDELAYTLNNLALARVGLGDAAEAEVLLAEARAVAELHDHVMRGAILANLAELYCATGRNPEGATLASAAIAANTASHGSIHWRTRQAEITAAWCGEPPAPAVVSGEALATILARWGEDNLYARRAVTQMGDIRAAQ